LPNSKPIHLVNWALVTRSKSLGGLGVRDLERTNMAVLIKWKWQWINGRRGGSMEQLQASTFWKDIMQVGRVFESVVTYQIRQGDRI
jgi:hypothetical protein